MSPYATAATDSGSTAAAMHIPEPARILVIDDEEIVAKTLKALLEADGYEVEAVSGGQEGLEALRNQQFAVALVDLRMAGMDGLATAQALKEADPEIEVIIVTGYATVNSTIAALRIGVCDFLQKPIGMLELRPAIRRALEERGRKFCQGGMRPPEAATVEIPGATCLSPINPPVQGGNSQDPGTPAEGDAATVSEAKLQAIFDGVETGIFLIDPSTHQILDANPLALRLIGADREHVLGSVCHKFVCPADQGRCPFTDLGQKVDNSERVLLTAAGSRTPIIKTVRRVTIHGREMLLESFFEISGRKKAEEALAEERDLLCALMDNVPDCIYFKDLGSRTVRSNMAHARSLGFKHPAEMVGKWDFDFFTSEHAQQAFDDEQEVIRTGIPIVAKEEKETWPDGRITWASSTKVARRDAEGKVIGTFGVSRDITERKRTEEELLLKTALLEAVAETTIDGILVVDDEGQVLQANRRFGELWNLPSGLLDTRDDAKFLECVLSQVKEPEAFLDRVKYLYTHESERTRDQIELNDGRVFDRYSSPLRNVQGKHYARIWYFRDITESKRAEAALRESESRFRRLIESNLFGIFVGTGDGCVREANAAFLQMLNYSEEDLRAGTIRWDQMTPPDFGQVNERIYQQLNTSGVSAPMEVEYLRKDGSRLPAMTGLLALDASVSKALGFVIDLTQRKEAEEKARESNELVSLLLDSIPEAVYGIDMQGNCTFCNPACLNLLGFEQTADVLGRNMHDLMHHSRQDGSPYPVDECRIYEAFRRGHGTHIDDEVLWRNDGTSFPAEYWSHPIYRGERAIGTVVTFIDITERKRAEEQSRLQTAALESAANGIAITDLGGQIIWVNPAFCHLTGYEQPEILGQTMRLLKSGEQTAKLYQELWRTIRAGEVWQGELINRRKDGTRYIDFTTITPVRDADGEITHFVSIKQDVTERREAERALEERTAYLNSLFELSPLGIVVLDTKGRIEMSNSTFEKLFLYPRSETIGALLDELIVPPEMHQEAKSLTAMCLSGPGARFTSSRRRKDGTHLDVDIYGVPIIIDDKLYGVLTLYQDVTERIRAEEDLFKYAEDLEVSRAAQEEHGQKLARLVEELAQERDLLGTLMDTLPDFVYLKDDQGRFLRANPATARALGLKDPREAVGKTDFDFFTEAEAQCYLRDERRVREEGLPLLNLMEKWTEPDGKYRWVSSSKVPIRDSQGRVTGLVGVGRDMTEHMQTEEKIRESEAKYRSLVSNIPDVIWTMDSQLQFAFISPNIERLSGYSLEEVYRCGAMLFIENIHPSDIEKVSRAMQALFLKGEPYDVECRVRRKDGEWMWVHDRAVFTYEKNGLRYADGLLSDITPSKRAEETLRASEETYRELFENSSDIVYTTRLDTRLTSLNRVGREILGYTVEEAAQLDLYQLVAPKHWGILKKGRERLLAGEREVTNQVEVITKTGRQITLEVKPRLIYRGGKPVGAQGIARDITGRDVAELELRHAQKLESVGRLASGIAHEINTPIQFVGDNTRFLQDSFGCLQSLLVQYQELHAAAKAGPVNGELLEKVSHAEVESDSEYLLEEIPKALAQTLEGVSRVATIVRAMKEFAHPESKEMAAADLNRAILSTLTVARNEIKYVADVETEFGELPLVVCNIGDLNQVFLNLLVNAAHAIGELVEGSANRGKIRVSTVSEGKTVLVTITDTGCGISEANRAKIFDPFFTTKEVGRGTGQGLAIARSVVVDRHKGSLTFESEVGVGTAFYIRLPIDPGDCPKEGKEA